MQFSRRIQFALKNSQFLSLLLESKCGATTEDNVLIREQCSMRKGAKKCGSSLWIAPVLLYHQRTSLFGHIRDASSDFAHCFLLSIATSHVDLDAVWFSAPDRRQTVEHSWQKLGEQAISRRSARYNKTAHPHLCRGKSNISQRLPQRSEAK